MQPESDPRNLAHVAATLFNVRPEIDSMQRCGVTAELLEEARRHAAYLADLTAQSERVKEKGSHHG